MADQQVSKAGLDEEDDVYNDDNDENFGDEDKKACDRSITHFLLAST